jgi:toxin ParE1/3/4
VTELAISARAELDLRDIWRYIAAENPDAADRVLRNIGKKIDLLIEFPDIGVRRDDMREGARVLVEGVYLILYEHRPADLIVEVVAVVDARRDLSSSP